MTTNKSAEWYINKLQEIASIIQNWEDLKDSGKFQGDFEGAMRIVKEGKEIMAQEAPWLIKLSEEYGLKLYTDLHDNDAANALDDLHQHHSGRNPEHVDWEDKLLAQEIAGEPGPCLASYQALKREVEYWKEQPLSFLIGQKVNVQWSQPMGIEKWAQIFKVHKNTMSEWFKNNTIENKHVSDRKWRVALHELPADLVKKVKNE